MEKKLQVILPSIPADQKVVGMPMVRNPDIVIQEAKKVATTLKKVIDSKAKKVVINGKRYIEFDDWQMLGSPYGVTAKVVETREIYDRADKKKIIGFLARAVAVKDDVEISAAEAECLVYERNWRNKAFNQRFMLRSMAQTRACSKVLSNVLRWVVVLAGYEATPAEEMTTTATKILPDRIRKTIIKLRKRKKIPKSALKKHIDDEYGVDSLGELSNEEGEELLTVLTKYKGGKL